MMGKRDTTISKAVTKIARELQAVYGEAVENNITRCIDCVYWQPNNAEECDTSGRCRYDYGPCQNQTTDAFWFCADGEGKDDG